MGWCDWTMPLQLSIHVESERLLIRPVSEADIPDLLLMNRDDETTRFLSYVSWRSVDDGMAWLRKIREMERAGTGVQLVLVEKSSESVVGGCLLFRYEESSARAELGYALARSHWRKGYMHEALVALIPHAFGPVGLRRLEAQVNLDNEPSCQLLERLGFKFEGLLRQRWVKEGKACDTRFYGLLREEWPVV
jgi:ribosomal-protein-alanine N-acetyltransferase